MFFLWCSKKCLNLSLVEFDLMDSTSSGNWNFVFIIQFYFRILYENAKLLIIRHSFTIYYISHSLYPVKIYCDCYLFFVLLNFSFFRFDSFLFLFFFSSIVTNVTFRDPRELHNITANGFCTVSHRDLTCICIYSIAFMFELSQRWRI